MTTRHFVRNVDVKFNLVVLSNSDSTLGCACVSCELRAGAHRGLHGAPAGRVHLRRATPLATPRGLCAVCGIAECCFLPAVRKASDHRSLLVLFVSCVRSIRAVEDFGPFVWVHQCLEKVGPLPLPLLPLFPQLTLSLLSDLGHHLLHGHAFPTPLCLFKRLHNLSPQGELDQLFVLPIAINPSKDSVDDAIHLQTKDTCVRT